VRMQLDNACCDTTQKRLWTTEANYAIGDRNLVVIQRNLAQLKSLLKKLGKLYCKAKLKCDVIKKITKGSN
jgi:hypothetical protein